MATLFEVPGVEQGSRQVANSRPSSAASVIDAGIGHRLNLSSSEPQLRSAGGLASGPNPSRQVWVEESHQSAASEGLTNHEQHDEKRADNDESRPSSRQNQRLKRPASQGSCRSGSQRFTAEELQCFRRVPTPSAACDTKAKDYYQTTGSLRRAFSEAHWHTLPVLKGKFFQHPELKDTPPSPSQAEKKERMRQLKRRQAEKMKSDEAEIMPQEALTATILNEIFPRNPKEAFQSVGEDKTKEGSNLVLANGNKRPSKGRAHLQIEINRSSSATARKQHPGAGGDSNSPNVKTRRPSKGRMLHSSTTGSSTIGAIPSSITGAGGGGSSGNSFSSQGLNPRIVMNDFREKILDKFGTVKEAFDCFISEIPRNRAFTKKEMLRILQRHGFEFNSREERECILNQLDFRSDGIISMSEFYIAIEAAVPIRNIEGLRQRLLASGFGSMMQAIQIMADHSTLGLSHRLPLSEFAERLSRVNVLDHIEHVAVFNSICSDRGHSPRVSIAELACAIATVSPSMLLEDVRERLSKKYNGDIEKAFTDLDMDHGGSVNLEEFVLRGTSRLMLSENEARKAFRDIDIDSSGEVERSEFLSAMGLSEPSLFLEDLRMKVRQRFASFQEYFAKAFSDSMTAELITSPSLNLQRFQELAISLGLRDSQSRALFHLLDYNKDNAITVNEFMRGMKHFAPSTALEEIRLRLSQKHAQVLDSFAACTTEDLTRMLDLEGFTKQLCELGLYDLPLPTNREASAEASYLQSGIRVQAIFDFLDIANNGQVCLSRLIAALQSCGAGMIVRLPTEELNLRAKQDIRGDMAPMHRLIGDIKMQVRQGVKFEERSLYRQADNIWTKTGTNITDSLIESGKALPKGMQKFLRKGNVPERKVSQSPRRASLSKGESEVDLQKADAQTTKEPDTSAGPPRLKTVPFEDVSNLLKNSVRSQDVKQVGKQTSKPSRTAVQGTQKSWAKLWDDLRRAPGSHNRIQLEMNLQNYFQTAAMNLSHDGHLFNGSGHSRIHLHEDVKSHQQALKGLAKSN